MTALSKAAFLSLALPLAAAAAAQAADTKEVHRTVALGRDGRVAINTYKGSIAVTTWDKPEVRVDAVIEPDGDYRDSREMVQWTQVQIRESGGSVTIKPDYEEAKHRSRGLLGLFDVET